MMPGPEEGKGDALDEASEKEGVKGEAVTKTVEETPGGEDTGEVAR